MKYLSDLNTEAMTGNEKDYTYLVHSGYTATDTHNDFLLSSAHAAI
jgi:ankyrin repeat protein